MIQELRPLDAPPPTNIAGRRAGGCSGCCVSLRACRCRTNLTHTRQSRPDPGLGCQTKVVILSCSLFARKRSTSAAHDQPSVASAVGANTAQTGRRCIKHLIVRFFLQACFDRVTLHTVEYDPFVKSQLLHAIIFGATCSAYLVT